MRGPTYRYALPTSTEGTHYPYYAPEYRLSGEVTYASDVYCVGLLMVSALLIVLLRRRRHCRP